VAAAGVVSSKQGPQALGRMLHGSLNGGAPPVPDMPNGSEAAPCGASSMRRSLCPGGGGPFASNKRPSRPPCASYRAIQNFKEPGIAQLVDVAESPVPKLNSKFEQRQRQRQQPGGRGQGGHVGSSSQEASEELPQMNIGTAYKLVALAREQVQQEQAAQGLLQQQAGRQRQEAGSGAGAQGPPLQQAASAVPRQRRSRLARQSSLQQEQT
jgi:hypothetical protein